MKFSSFPGSKKLENCSFIVLSLVQGIKFFCSEWFDYNVHFARK